MGFSSRHSITRNVIVLRLPPLKGRGVSELRRGNSGRPRLAFASGPPDNDKPLAPASGFTFFDALRSRAPARASCSRGLVRVGKVWTHRLADLPAPGLALGAPIPQT